MNLNIRSFDEMLRIFTFGFMSRVCFFLFFLTYIYLSKHKYNKTYKVPHKTTQDEKYVQKW